MVRNVNCGIIQLPPCPSPGEVPSREEVNCFLKLHLRIENGQMGGDN